MQVKKFEARTVKEALDLIKSQLGPDAIILSVRDNKKAYGLVGEGSVEITAAASDESIRKRKAVESRLPQEKKEKFQNSPARMQKEIINQFVEHHHKKEHVKQSASRRYIDIEDDLQRDDDFGGNEDSFLMQKLQSTQRMIRGQKEPLRADTRATSERAPMTAQERKMQAAVQASVVTAHPAPNKDHEIIHSLQGEIRTLKQMITQFQQVPQKIHGSTYPGSDFGLPFEFTSIYSRLTDHGVASEIAGELLVAIQESLPPAKLRNRSLIEGVVAKSILDSVKVRSFPFPSRIQVFMGPPSSGKTSALVKLASQLMVKENKTIAIATADTFKVGAADQMRIYSSILNAPFSIIRSKNDWMNLLKSSQSFDYLFVDYPGLTLRTNEEQNLLERLLPPAGISKDLHLVLSAKDQDHYLTETGARYQKLGFDDVLFNFLDETYHHGSLLNFQNRFQKPFLGFGLGGKIPEDFEFATSERVLDLVMKITQSAENRMMNNDK